MDSNPVYDHRYRSVNCVDSHCFYDSDIRLDNTLRF